MKKILLPIAYLPNTAYMASILQADEVWVEACENYVKQSYRNRSYILTANGVVRLSVPVLHHGKVPIRELEIDYKQQWQNQHWRAIQSAYAKSPFFEHFEGPLADAIYRREDTLFDYNLNLLETCLQLVGRDPELRLTPSFRKSFKKGVIQDDRALFHPKNDLHVVTPTYFQCFGEEFAPNLSIVDLLFCQGPQVLVTLQKTRSALLP